VSAPTPYPQLVLALLCSPLSPRALTQGVCFDSFKITASNEVLTASFHVHSFKVLGIASNIALFVASKQIIASVIALKLFYSFEAMFKATT
jgi:hypothetical protein